MNTKMNKLALAMGALVMAGGAMAATDSATIAAEVIVPIAVANVVDLDFGNLAIGNGAVTVATNGVRTAAGALPLVVFGSAPTAAKFNVTGQGAQTFSISTAGTSTVLTGPPESTAMTFTLITEALAGVDAAATNKITDTAATGALFEGGATIYAGGTVVVAAAQAAGTYAGTVAVTVEYN